MSSSSSPLPDTPNPNAATAPQNRAPGSSDPASEQGKDNGEREAEWGFSLFMKDGGYKDAFIGLGRCFAEAAKNKGEDIIQRCHKATADLNKCMESKFNYYHPVFLVAEKAAEEVAVRELEKGASGLKILSDPPTANSNPDAASGVENQIPDPPTQEEEQGDDGGEEEGECGFCLFMKGGDCRDTFIEWEKCIEEAEKKGEDIVEKCFQATAALKTCMEAHSDYYEPILRAEKAAEEEAVRELEKEANELKASEKIAAGEQK